MSTTVGRMDSPVGMLRLAVNAAGLCLIEFAQPRHPVAAGDDWREGDHPLLREAQSQLDAYFAEVRGVEPSPAPLIELDILYEFPAAYAGTSARDAAAPAP